VAWSSPTKPPRLLPRGGFSLRGVCIVCIFAANRRDTRMIRLGRTLEVHPILFVLRFPGEQPLVAPARPQRRQRAREHRAVPGLDVLELVVDAVNDVRRADGALPNEKVTLDSLAPEVRDQIGEGATAARDAAYHYAQVALGAATGALPDNSVGTAVLQVGAVTEPKLADDAVTAAKLANEAVAEPKLSRGLSARIGALFGTVQELLADTTLSYSNVAAGDLVEAGGFRYAVAASGASNQHVTTAGGVKLYVMLTPEGEIHVDAWGAVGDGTAVAGTGTDNAVVLQKVCDYAIGYLPTGRNGKPPVIRFGAGKVYAYSVSPNWSRRSWLRVRGSNTTMRNLGTGDAVIWDSGPSTDPTAYQFNQEFTGFLIEGGPNSGRGVYIRSCHHGLFDFEVRGCGTTRAGLEVDFAVCTEFRVAVSKNRAPWYAEAIPRRGIILNRRGAGEGTTACYFPNPIIEGVSSVGIQLNDADQCTFIGGTSEGNVGANVLVEVDSRHNIFKGIDLEVSDSGQSFIDRGWSNVWERIYADQLCTFSSTSRHGVISGFVNGITDSGTGTLLEKLLYGIADGVITTTGNAIGTQQRLNVVNFASGNHVPVVNELRDLRIGGGAGQIRKTVTAQIDLPAFTVPTSVPGPSDKTGLVISGVTQGDIALIDLPGLPREFTADAIVTADDTVSVRVTQLYGEPINPFSAGVRARLIFLRN
jgi:hypothetical protein